MLWQSMAMARIGPAVGALAYAEHTALHRQAVDHHHHEDGSYHLGDSKDSAQHMVSDHLSPWLAMVTCSSDDLAPVAAAVHGGRHEARLPSPTLDGLLRPPRPRA